MSGASDRELIIPNDTKYLSVVRETISETIRASEFPHADISRIILAVDEAVANIMEHAYERDTEGRGEIELRLHADRERFEVTVRDSGQAFNPDQVVAPDMDEHVRLGRKNGLGIFLMRKIMDQVNYRFEENGRNELRMIKFARSDD